MVERIDKEYSEAFMKYLDKRFKGAGGGAGGIDLRLIVNGDGIVHGEYKNHKFQSYFTADPNHPRNHLKFHFSYEVHGRTTSHKDDVKSKKSGLTKLIGNPKYKQTEVPNVVNVCYPLRKLRKNIKDLNDIYHDIWSSALKDIFKQMQSFKL